MHAFEQLKQIINSDREYAWAFFCNLAVPVLDATGCDHRASNEAGALIMAQMFDHDITAHPLYEYEKSTTQECFEMRRDADRDY